MQAKTINLEKIPYNIYMKAGRPAKQKRSPFGTRLNQARLTAGLSQIEIAEKLGITQSAYAAWERESIALRSEQIDLLCSILKIRVEELYEDKPVKRSNGPTGKARRLFEEVHNLPHRQQQRILATVEDMLLAQQAKAQ
jgi:transcriptional regulator with XRE-family HTH domain